MTLLVRFPFSSKFITVFNSYGLLPLVLWYSNRCSSVLTVRGSANEKRFVYGPDVFFILDVSTTFMTDLLKCISFKKGFVVSWWVSSEEVDGMVRTCNVHIETVQCWQLNHVLGKKNGSIPYPLVTQNLLLHSLYPRKFWNTLTIYLGFWNQFHHLQSHLHH